ncbi:LysM peptidoglycan-binding domain-containing M23 family metallopeptidase [Streptomyces sp. DG2A-72]|uniref:LysM peptidoglycan-binding domain-containing M23 family metallopeptidase n=1 Tax=Streptomyces sp. DG2A-72 TaxID=3051386 RepID=UPI00265C7C3A|nr:LysM peptidoglycan-binding domain-containing M23 family metallopeptidase [Streptomyces sp. DG2A-72]MDO0938268.1 LysM peptidoglycan-binding domain-containing M23 family metallopeptidase [Streptomyces sp. DG2A-72]
MPAKGKHRRPKSQRFTRSIVVAGTGGAALALPLLGATGAHAAPAKSVSEKAVQSVPKTEKKAAEKTAAAKSSGVRTYSVRAGDYLSKIADEQNVSGGWQKLYADNREAVGSDPSMIHPGLKLSIGKKAATGSSKPSSSSSDSSPSSSSSKKSSGSSDSSGSSASGSSKSSSNTATTQSSDTTSTAGGFTLPVAGARVGTPYRMSGSMWSSGYHTGVDFVVPTGTSLKSVGAGTVVSAGWGGAYGNQVVVKLADGYYAQYAHLSSLSVSNGQTVTEGQQIGLSGATGNVTGPHLHFEIRTTPDYGSDVDPVAYLRSKGVSVS